MIWRTQGSQRIASIGECMIELTQQPGDTVRRAFCGDTLNTAVYLARLLQGTNTGVHYISRVGRDPLSAAMLASWRDEGIDVSLVEFDNKRLPGLYYVSTDTQGERTFYYWRKNSAASAMLNARTAANLQKQLADFDAVYVTGITLAILPPAGRRRLLVMLQRLRANGVTTVFDSNYRQRLWSSVSDARKWLHATGEHIDVLLTGLSDEQAVFGDSDAQAVSERLRKTGIAELIIKNGAAACLAVEPTGVQTIDVPVATRVVDTTAAGDAFNAGYIAARVSGLTVQASVLAAQQLAARVIAHAGAIIPRQQTPTLAQLS